MATKRTPYEILGITPNTDPREGLKVYRKLSMQYHPDRNPGDREAAAAKFKEIDKAWKEIRHALFSLTIPEGASEQKIKELIAAALNAIKDPRQPQPPASSSEHVWTTVASESAGNAIVPDNSRVMGDWTRQRIKRGRAAHGLETITPDEAAHLIYSRPHAFAALKIVQRMHPELCLYDAILLRAKGASYKPPPSQRRSNSTALVIYGTEAVDREACQAALRDPLASVAVAVQQVGVIA